MAHTRVIVNPIAGAGKTAKKWPQIIDLLRSLGMDFEHDLTEGPGHAIELAKSAAKNGCELIVSVGGDGTINEIVNGLYDAGSIGDVTLGIVSTGTGADYIRTIGVPRACMEASRCLTSPRRPAELLEDANRIVKEVEDFLRSERHKPEKTDSGPGYR